MIGGGIVLGSEGFCGGKGNSGGGVSGVDCGINGFDAAVVSAAGVDGCG